MCNSPDGGSDSQPPCELLPWDGEHFGCVVALVRGSRLGAKRAQEVDRWCREHRVDCLYLLADARDSETARIAAQHGHRVVDVRLTFEHELEGLGGAAWHSPGPCSVRLASEDDLPALRPLAASSHHDSRFYFDGCFAEDRCDELYVKWIERALRDPGFELLVPVLEERPIGYQAIRLPGVEGGRLDLVALDPRHQGRGLARHLLVSALRRLAELGADRVLTSLQARNVASLRAHERIGFVVERTEVWHHKWYGPDDA